jgi:hypothetical protein
MKRSWRVAGVGLAAVAMAVTSQAVAGADETVALKIVAPGRNTVLERFSRNDPVNFAELVNVHASGGDFEVHAFRNSYDVPIEAEIVNGSDHTPIAPELFDGYNGFKNAFHVRVTNSVRVVAEYDSNWCPNDGRRSHADPATGPEGPKYPDGCFYNPFTTGMVWGIEDGWASSLGGSFGTGWVFGLPDGHYRMKVWWNRAFAKAMGQTEKMTIVDVVLKTDPNAGGFPFGLSGRAGNTVDLGTGPAVPGRRVAAESAHHEDPLHVRREPANLPIRSAAADIDTVPDLASLPAYGIGVSNRLGGKDYLNFGATVWNAGPAPLVVEGFREPDATVMDAYQYFYENGERVDRALVGSMAYDDRTGHKHWHFKDFAKYELVNINKHFPLKSGKEAFCLAETDAIDLLVPNAEWRQSFDDLGSVCGSRSSIWIRESLAVGYGDTYSQARPGQAFDITNVPNGMYYIKVTANPDSNLQEVTADNNISYRKIKLNGTKGHRTVKLFDVGLISTW